MPMTSRFGRKLRLSPTSVIKHQLRLMSATDSLADAITSENHTPGDLQAILRTLIEQYKLSPDRAGMLADRLGIGRASPALV